MKQGAGPPEQVHPVLFQGDGQVTSTEYCTQVGTLYVPLLLTQIAAVYVPLPLSIVSKLLINSVTMVSSENLLYLTYKSLGTDEYVYVKQLPEGTGVDVGVGVGVACGVTNQFTTVPSQVSGSVAVTVPPVTDSEKVNECPVNNSVFVIPVYVSAPGLPTIVNLLDTVVAEYGPDK